MSRFKGSYSYSVDSKGRVSIPAKMRTSVSPEAKDTFTITRGFEKCVFIYPQDEWEKYEARLAALSPVDEKERFFVRVLLQSAVEQQPDAQARIIIPRELLKHAEIDREVKIIGALEHIEVWNPRVYDAYISAQDETYEEVAKKFLSKG